MSCCLTSERELAFDVMTDQLALAGEEREKAAQEPRVKELPYVIDCPASYEVRAHPVGYGQLLMDTLNGRSSIVQGFGDKLTLPCPLRLRQDLLALLAEHATSADDINTILDRIHKNHRRAIAWSETRSCFVYVAVQVDWSAI